MQHTASHLLLVSSALFSLVCPLSFHPLYHHNFSLLAVSLPSFHIAFPHAAVLYFHFVWQLLI